MLLSSPVCPAVTVGREVCPRSVGPFFSVSCLCVGLDLLLDSMYPLSVCRCYWCFEVYLKEV